MSAHSVRLAQKVLLPALGMGRKQRARGFTLVELMITVAIVAVLAAIGIFGVRRYLFAAKSSEAINLIGSIKSAEEAYRDETFTYLNVSGTFDDGSYYPQSPLGKREKIMWGGAHRDADNWRTLGVNPGQPVQFGYACVAGAAGGTPPNVGTTPAYEWPETINGPWYVVKAIGDQDGDNDPSIFVGSSFTTEIYVENETE